MYQPWIEKYRPQKLDEIVLSYENKTILKNMIKDDCYPNMIFYGSPGTGKTTTILRLIDSYQKKHHCKNNYIHLNASHQRGIDVIRNQIFQFTENDNFFHNKKKFVLLDEVDSMTKQAQKHLFYIIKNCTNNVCFILICNYLNKLIPNIINSLMILSFHNISMHSDKFIQRCIKNENLSISKKKLECIKNIYIHDLRSIINTLQNYDNDIKFIDMQKVKDVCCHSNFIRKFKLLHKEFDIHELAHCITLIMYENFDVDYRLLKQLYYFKYYNQDIDYLHHVIINHFHKLNKIE
jgi:replication factor C subunit 3/5